MGSLRGSQGCGGEADRKGRLALSMVGKDKVQEPQFPLVIGMQATSSRVRGGAETGGSGRQGVA